MISINKNFTAGNIKVLKITETEVLLENELRDTISEDWFYWAFCVEGAAGKTITFKFNQNNRVGYYGAAVSENLIDWSWTETANNESFSYSFSKNQNKVYFAHHMLYLPERFNNFANSNNLQIKTFTKSKKGRDVPCLRLGNGQKHILLTARHHACESTGNYIIEGFLKQYLKNPLNEYTLVVVPFVDFDGVIEGDQGKARHPFDHNRDYGLDKESIYNETKAIRELATNNKLVFGFDFHSPWHKGGVNDTVFIVQKSYNKIKQLNKFAAILETFSNGENLNYDKNDDYPPDYEWNRSNGPSFANYIQSKESCEISFTLETNYFGNQKHKFTQERALRTGENFYKALIEYISQNETQKLSFTGDLLCYEPMINACKTQDSYDFASVFSGLKEVLKSSNSVVGNLETPIAGTELELTNERYRFNSPKEYLRAVALSGVNIFSLANNHCMDRGTGGLINTINNLEEFKLDYIGAYKTREDSQKILVKEYNGTKVAFLNYTYGTNAFAHKTYLKDNEEYMINLIQPEELKTGAIDLLQSNQEIGDKTNEIYNENNKVCKEIISKYQDKVKSDIAKAKSLAEVVIVSLHSGGQYNEHPDPFTKLMFQKIYSYGADLVVGNHPHIIQPCEQINNNLNIYCLGNNIYCESTVTTQSPIDKSYSVILHTYLKNKKIEKITFSLMKIITKDQKPECVDTFELCNSGLLNSQEALQKANYFANTKKYTKIQKEYLLK